jgi:hypothetical protein
LVFALTASAMPRRSNARRTWAPAALAGTGGDGLRLEQRLFHRVGRADVGLRGAGADGDAEADARDLRRRAGHELGLRAGVLEHLLRDHAGVERVAARGLLDQLGRGAEEERELMAGGALEARAELAHRAGDSAARQDRELGSLHVDHRQ